MAERTLVAVHCIEQGGMTFKPGEVISNGSDEDRQWLVENDAAVWGDEADPLDRDRDGKRGGDLPDDPPSLTGKNRAELSEIADKEGVDLTGLTTNAQIAQAIEDKRAAAGEAPPA